MIRNKISLNGLWHFSIPGSAEELRTVPGSYPCVGDSIYRKCFPTPQPVGRTFLCFEGIAYEGKVICNGIQLGFMLPYSYYRFDITDLLKQEGDNEVILELQDLTAVFGPSEGWKSYSGIVREVYLEQTAKTYLSDVFFTYELAEGYTSVSCETVLTFDGPTEGLMVCASLTREGRTVAETGLMAAGQTPQMTVALPALWSPAAPNLYQLEVQLVEVPYPGTKTIIDTYTCAVGFKDLQVKNSKFLLNGKDLFITGVCRHDIWDDKVGFTQTDAMIEKDLVMMKQMGVNYVRLVHYPHDRRVVAAADRLGLLVSEEPGLWWSDLSNKAITSRALSVLEKVIYRDRNHVSVAFWLSFNECIFDEDFLRDTMAVARRCDPTRLISGANCNDTHETKRLFDKYGVDFYTMHPYGSLPSHVNGNTLEDVCRVLCDKPVIFTEWGGYYVDENPALFRDFCTEMLRLHRNEAPEPTLAGMSYWQWQDIPEYQRGEPACHDGILTEGLVTIQRQPKTNYYTFMRFLESLRIPEMPQAYEFIPVGGGAPEKQYQPLPLPQPERDVWEAAIIASTPMHGYYHKKNRRITVGPKLPCHIHQLGALTVDMPAGKPVVLGVASGSIDIPVGQKCSALWIIGQATMGKGYPVDGQRGEAYGSYTLHYADGTSQFIPLRNGLESATVFGLIGPTEFDPRAAHTGRAFTLSYDKNWEIYRTGLIRLETGKELASIHMEVTHPDYFLPVYGVTLEI